MGGSRTPSARHANTTVTWQFPSLGCLSSCRLEPLSALTAQSSQHYRLFTHLSDPKCRCSDPVARPIPSGATEIQWLEHSQVGTQWLEQSQQKHCSVHVAGRAPRSSVACSGALSLGPRSLGGAAVCRLVATLLFWQAAAARHGHYRSGSLSGPDSIHTTMRLGRAVQGTYGNEVSGEGVELRHTDTKSALHMVTSPAASLHHTFSPQITSETRPPLSSETVAVWTPLWDSGTAAQGSACRTGLPSQVTPSLNRHIVQLSIVQNKFGDLEGKRSGLEVGKTDSMTLLQLGEHPLEQQLITAVAASHLVTLAPTTVPVVRALHVGVAPCLVQLHSFLTHLTTTATMLLYHSHLHTSRQCSGTPQSLETELMIATWSAVGLLRKFILATTLATLCKEMLNASSPGGRNKHNVTRLQTVKDRSKLGANCDTGNWPTNNPSTTVQIPCLTLVRLLATRFTVCQLPLNRLQCVTTCHLMKLSQRNVARLHICTENQKWSGWVWVALNIEVSVKQDKYGVALECNWGNKRSPEKNCQPKASYSTISTCENPGATPPGLEHNSPWWETGPDTTDTHTRDPGPEDTHRARDRETHRDRQTPLPLHLPLTPHDKPVTALKGLLLAAALGCKMLRPLQYLLLCDLVVYLPAPP
ncbi:hypothetical protein PR048_000384 [Dryococelus australis]|uniref:Uncharacterized protein n=1 Tax=Dryococelus australis TaxID=614101 RepID=A0ABQ9IFM9_9NEOP|nr:hypothetical protein PR048_000384 [Dryococelus australis]